MSVESPDDPFDWDPPSTWRRITTVDAHTGGEPLRVILAGFPELSGTTVLARRREARTEWDDLRTALMWEPRGHGDMYGCLLTPPESEDATAGVLFLHNEGFSTMCGHGIIAVTTVLIELGMVTASEPRTPIVLDTPAGRIEAAAQVDAGRVGSVEFQNVPSWAELGLQVDVAGLGRVDYDLGYGGAFYAVVDAAALGVELTKGAAGRLVELGRAIKAAIQANRPPHHPAEPDLSFLYGTIFVGPAAEAANHSRNVCVFADGEVDRSPTGTGVSARLAIHHARGDIDVDQPVVIESILGTTFTGRVVATMEVAGRAAVVPAVEGRAWITGRHEFLIDPSDPLRDGFLLR